ncbi:MAG: PHP domain-containing protein, partial [Chitinophagaceae bacterium]|nr:PHP domain-containing protein [Chitinophagaceae bacterium]
MYLNCKTFFSFRYGTFKTEELVVAGIENGAKALALTNINSTCDAWDFAAYCNQYKIKPVLGAEIRNGDKLLYILLAANNDGFAWVNEFISAYPGKENLFPVIASENHFFNNINDGFVIYPYGNKSADQLFPNERIGILSSEINKLFGIEAQYAGKFVIRQPVTFYNKKHFNTHRLLRAIDKNVLLSKLPKEAEASPDEVFIAEDELKRIFGRYPSVIENTLQV